MNKLLCMLCAVALLAGCTGNPNQQEQQPAADTFYSSQYSGNDRNHNQRNNDRPNNTGEYRSTGDASLLDVKLPQRLDNQTVKYKAITVYYNKYYRVPNCVAYELTNTQVSMADAPDAQKRDNYQFNRDNNVSGCPDWWEYKETGYDRGHMAPAMDMRWDRQAMAECFLMTNMCPQIEQLNNGPWKSLEESVHRWAKRDGSIWVYTGPIMGIHVQRIGPNGDIAVPAAFYKVLYAPRQQRAIAFIYDNQAGGGGMARHATTVAEVERRTGITFFPRMAAATARSLKRQCNLTQWR